MTHAELRELATRIIKANQRYFWVPERSGEKNKVTKAFNILKEVEHFGYRIVSNDSNDEANK